MCNDLRIAQIDSEIDELTRTYNASAKFGDHPHWIAEQVQELAGERERLVRECNEESAS